MQTLENMLLGYFPKSADCMDGHIGRTILTWFWEQEDDHGTLMKIERCSHCNLPNGKENYATDDDKNAYYRGEQPKKDKEEVNT
ncbi:MAG: hypothetical protein HKM07_08195 [Chlamydiae bacterium]|nr:hypothetical protein [Chlamydiota bacterium]